MHEITVTESKESEPLDLSPAAVEALSRMGRRLASQKSWWGEGEDSSTRTEPTAIKCIPVAGGQWRVRVDNAVGVVSVGDVQIAVQPKIHLPHLLYLFSLSGAIPRVDEQLASLPVDQSLWELVAQWFASSAELLMRRGLMRDYQEAREDLPLVRGRVHPSGTASNFYRGRLAFDCEYEEFDVDTPLNRTVLAASRSVAASPLLGSELRRRGMRVAAHLDEGVGALERRDLLASTDRRTSHYREAIPLAHHVLRSHGRTIATGDELGWSFLIPTPALVEEGVRRLLDSALGSVTKRGRQLEGSTLRFMPDLVFGNVMAVGDVKYKLSASTWNRADLYEVLSFGVAFEVRDVCLVTFSSGEREEHLEPLDVGEMHVTHLRWDASPSRDPKDAAASLVRDAGAWLQEVSLKTLGQNSAGSYEAATSG